MGRGRDLYFTKHIQNAPTVETYLSALLNSPYRTHRRMGIALGPELERLVEEKKKADESAEFAESLKI
jgi:hypothetical protein